MDRRADIVVVGAGAAGLATAIFTQRLLSARRRPSRPRESSVLLLDGASKPGAKILVSGGARCNVTNTVVTEADFWGGRRAIVRRILRAFPAREAAAFFRDLGVPLHEETDGKLFPDSNRSRDVLDALLREASARDVPLLPGHRVLNVTKRGPAAFSVLTSRGDIQSARVVLATGGLSLPKTGSDGAGLEIARRLGHTIVPTTPALAPLLLALDEPLHHELAGVSLDAELALWSCGAIEIRLRGSLLWTHFGVSGPVALNASRHWLRAVAEGREPSLTVSFLPGETFEAADARLRELARQRPRASPQTILSTLVPSSLAAGLLEQLGVDTVVLAHLARGDRRRLARALVQWSLPVVDSRGYNFAEATAGGISLEEIDPSTMESRVCPGLSLVGEMLDVDGRIGGFNFQWAWSSAWVAARALSESTR